MKTCDEFRARLSAYHDGEAGDKAETIHAHVDACDACRRILDGFRNVSGRLRDGPEAPVTLVEGIRRRVREEGPRRRGKTVIPKFAAAAVIVAALLWSIVLVGTRRDERTPSPNLAPGGSLSESEQRVLYGKSPTEDEWIAIILSGGRPQ